MDGLQDYDFTAGVSSAPAVIGAQGRLIYYYAGSAGGADSTIRVRPGNSGQSFLLTPGKSYKLPADAPPPDSWYISNYAKTAPILGTLLIGDGDFKDNNISGSVSVIDGGKSRTLGGTAFLGSGSVGQVAAQYSHLQLWNPAGSGKNASISAWDMSSSLAATVVAFIMNTQLTTLVSQVASKLGGGSAGLCQVRKQNQAAQVVGTQMSSESFAANTTFIKTLKEPIVLPPGYGLTLATSAQAVDLAAAFELVEDGV